MHKYLFDICLELVLVAVGGEGNDYSVVDDIYAVGFERLLKKVTDVSFDQHDLDREPLTFDGVFQVLDEIRQVRENGDVNSGFWNA